MQYSHELKQERSELLDKMEIVLDKVKGEKRDFTNVEAEELRQLRTKVEGLNSEITIQQINEVKKDELAELKAENREFQRQDLERKLNGKVQKITPSIFAASARALFNGNVNEVNNGNLNDILEVQKRAGTSTSYSSAIQNPLIASDIIFTTLAQSYLDQLGVDVFDLKANYYQLPKVTGYPTVTAFNEGDQITDSDITVDAVKFDVKNYYILVRVHNNVLRDAGTLTDQIIQGAFTRAINDKMLKEILHGTTGSKGFNGIDNVSGTLTVDAGSATLSNYDKIVEAYTDLMGQNVDASKIGFLANSTVAKQFGQIKATDNQPLEKPQILTTMPMVYSQAVKSDYGASSDETRAYIADWSTVKLGVEGQYNMRLVERYADYDQTAFMVVVRADLKLFEPNFACIIENIATA
ncbi:MAG: phage major capsid protein [Saprospiraceae bacterium]|nr:phage major capsid protein [Saprospiraceae bacterium]